MGATDTWLDDDAARHLAAYLVGRFRRADWGKDRDNAGELTLHDHPDAMRTCLRAAIDRLRSALAPDEAVVFVDGSYLYGAALGTAAVSATAVALTTERALAVRATQALETDEVTLADLEEQPLADVEIDRKRLLGTRELHLRQKVFGGFELSSKSRQVVERVRAFVASPDPTPFPELAELLAMPRLESGARPPDWYPDPSVSGMGSRRRWWDGTAWTNDVGRPGTLTVDVDFD